MTLYGRDMDEDSWHICQYLNSEFDGINIWESNGIKIGYTLSVRVRDVTELGEHAEWDRPLRTKDEVANYFGSASLGFRISKVYVYGRYVSIELVRTKNHTTNINANVIESLLQYCI